MDSGKTSPCVEPHSTITETVSKVTSSFESEPIPIRSMVRKLPNSCVPPGQGKNRTLTRLARLQRVLTKRVATECGLEFPYVTQEVMQEIEANREQ